MQLRSIALVLSGLSVILFATAANAQDGKGKGKRSQSEKVELKDVPPSVNDAAKKELPGANFTSAQKHARKKLGTIYMLEGTDGKYQVTAMISSSGELLSLTKSLEWRKKKSG